MSNIPVGIGEMNSFFFSNSRCAVGPERLEEKLSFENKLWRNLTFGPLIFFFLDGSSSDNTLQRKEYSHADISFAIISIFSAFYNILNNLARVW